MLYTKPYLSLTDQLNLIKKRGLEVDNDDDAIECLHRNGYYRLSAYWYPFREIIAGTPSDTFLPDSCFADAVALYRFDKTFKLLLLDALERVEIAVRVEIALLLGQRNPFAHEVPGSFHPRFTSPPPSRRGMTYNEWINKLHEQARRSKSEFVRHYESKYGSGSQLPIWIAIELWDFGLLSNAYSGLRNPDQIAVATRFAVPDWKLMKSWLQSLNYVRNVIAHHGRLWNLSLTTAPCLPQRGQMSNFDALLTLSNPGTRLYSICCILSHLTSVINPRSPWIYDLKNLVKGFSGMPHANVQRMGFPPDWQTHGFWT